MYELGRPKLNFIKHFLQACKISALLRVNCEVAKCYLSVTYQVEVYVRCVKQAYAELLGPQIDYRLSYLHQSN